MRFRKPLMVFLSLLAIGGASLGAAFAASSPQSTEGATSDPSSVQPEIAPDPKAYLGVAVQPLTDPVREALGLPAELEGAVVVRAHRDSPAAEAGLQRGDVVLSANGAPVTAPKDLKDVVSGLSPGGVLPIVYYRDGGEHSVDVTLGERPTRGGGHRPSGTQNPLKRFLNIFPKAVDGSFRVLDDDGNIQVYEMARGSITEITGDALTIEKATGETATFQIGADTLIVKNGHKVELSDLAVGDEASVLSVDGQVKAVVVGPLRQTRTIDRIGPRSFGGGFGGFGPRGFGPRLDRLEQHFRGLRNRMNRLHPPAVEEPPVSSDPPADSTAA